MFKVIASLFFIVALSACGTVQKAQYSALEKVGIHKRDILVDRIEDTAQAQEDTKQQFQSAYEQFANLVKVDDKGLEKQYKRLSNAVERSEKSSNDLQDRIDSVDEVANALFDEWQQELNQYSNPNLRRISAKNLNSTRQRYKLLLQAMQDSYRTIEPVLSVLQDNTLYLKHNLNANAISSLHTEVGSIENKVQLLIKEMEVSIRESQQFIEGIKTSTK